MELAEEAGADKVVRLQVGAAFHSELMEPVQERARRAMEGVSWRDPDVPLVSNASGEVADDGVGHPARRSSRRSRARCAGSSACGPSRRGLRHAISSSGPGRVLSGLVRQILGMETDTASVDSPAKLETFAASRPDAART